MGDLKDVVDQEFLEAGRGTFQEGRGGWNMAAVSKVPMCISIQPKIIQTFVITLYVASRDEL